MQGPPINPPEEVSAEYRLVIIAGIAAAHRSVLRAINGDLDQTTVGRILTGLTQRFRRFLSDGDAAEGVVDLARAGQGFRVIRSSIRTTERLHREALRAVVTETVGRAPAARLTRRRVDAILQAAIRRNLTLIRGVTDQQIVLIESALTQALQQPELQGSALVDRLAEIQGKGQNRAALIADNEIANFHSDLQMQRFSDLGVEEYVWRTSQDERVRRRPISHVALDGQTFRVGHPTTAEGGLPPGKPIRCRCVALPVFVVRDNG